MKKKLIISLKLIALMLLFLSVTTGCKKDKKEEEAKNNPSLVGEWGHVRSLGTGRNQVTQITLNADGTGNEVIFNTSFSGATTISDENIKWLSEKDVLKLIFKDGLVDEFQFALSKDAKTLTLTNKSGDAKEFFKQ
ncbi:MAG: hypothetical protein EOO93_21460 [Pedobacter sp.]|nr:MAG: hypothetical protein EOO93_21460 [Pedobacter sp.]